jgi:two-component system NarL family sensor kinase
MQLRLKLALFTMVPIVLALGLVAMTVQQQTLKLASQERELVGSAYLLSKETELRHYVQLAVSALHQIARTDQPLAVQQRQALAVLTGMKFGGDGYFFVYDRHNNVLLDAQQMGQPGVDLCDPGSPAGAVPAKLIISTARSGGGLVRYPWQKPSSRQTVPKLAYVTLMDGWDWVVGTGLYLDDVDEALRRIDERAKENIHATRLRIYAIAAACIVLIGAAGLALNISDHRVLSAKLRRLAQRVVRSQEDERLRLARELHDGVVQVLVSSKFTLETAQLHLRAQQDAEAMAARPPGAGMPGVDGDQRRAPGEAGQPFDADRPGAAGAARPSGAGSVSGAACAGSMLDCGLARLNEALIEIRRVSHGLRPALLDDLGLAAALALLVEQVQPGPPGDHAAAVEDQRSGGPGIDGCPGRLAARLVLRGDPLPLPTSHATALFRVAQEALANAQRHAQASRVDIVLKFGAHHVSLAVLDNGRGFALRKVHADRKDGIGLRNMRERIEGLGGRFTLSSSRFGTRIRAVLPDTESPTSDWAPLASTGIVTA